jgi:dynein heavy chain
LEWIGRQVQNAFKTVKPEKLDKFFEAEATQETISTFLDTADARLLMLTESGGTITVSLTTPKQARGNQMYMLKLNQGPVSHEGFIDEVVVGDVVGQPLQSLARAVNAIYMPLLSNGANQGGWSEMVTKDVMERLQNMLSALQITEGHCMGQVRLPLPPEDVKEEGGAAAGDADGALGEQKDRIHVLEGCLITWTKQIKDVLKLEPESKLQVAGAPPPGPLAEVAFWREKSASLNSIFDQLQSERVRKVLRFLDQSKSTYNLPFAKLCKEVFHGRAEANDNYKYLRPVEPWFRVLQEEGQYADLKNCFRPIMHLILAVWKGSRFYNMPSRLVVLMRELCSALVARSAQGLSGKEIFEMIDEGEAHKVVEKLRHVLQVCGHFKSVYFDYKAKANAECPNNQWRVQNNALFVRLDQFLERCHDLLELSLTIVAFSKLEKIEIGGTKGKTLSTSVQHLFADFVGCVAAMRAVPYDVMDLDAKGFDDDFYAFRGRMREMERRVASVVTQAFDDASTLQGRFQLMDAFDGLLERPLVHDELEQKHGLLIESYAADLAVVQQLLVENREDPPIAANLPPTAGALTWCHGLQERIANPMEKFKGLGAAVLEREEAKDVVKVYTQLMASCAEYKHSKIEAWGLSIENSSQAQLKLPLLRRDPETNLLQVNFDPALIKLLREVKYFLLLGLEVPEPALNVYKKGELFRRQTGNCDLIVNMYNEMQTVLLPVERPLLKGHLDKIDGVLAKGIKNLNWKSNGVDIFLSGAMSDMKEADGILTGMKQNLRKAEVIMAKWSEVPLMLRPTKPVTVADFKDLQKSMLNQKYATMKQGGDQVNALLKDTNKKLRVSSGLPDWKAYVDFMNNIVVEGLVKTTIVSMDFLTEQIDHEAIAKDHKSPLLEIELDLFGKDVSFRPDVAEQADRTGVRDVVSGWTENFFRVAHCFKRLDTGEGSYLKELREEPYVRAALAKITAHLILLEKRTDAARERYGEYAYLWTSNLSAIFSEFVEAALLGPDGKPLGEGEEAPVAEGEGEGEDGEVATKAPPEPLLDLDKFDEKIRYFLGIQAEVAELHPTTDILFLRIDSQPIKQALSTWVTKWIFMFTQHLQDHLTKKLTRVSSFMNVVNGGLAADVSDGNEETLMSVMGHVRDVRRVMEETPKTFPPLRDLLALLRSHGITMEDTFVDCGSAAEESVVDCLENVPHRWADTVNHTFKVKEAIQPMQNQMVEQIKTDLAAFAEELLAFDAHFRGVAPFDVKDPDFPAVYLVMQDAQKELASMEARAARFNELEELFELSISSHTKLHHAAHDLGVLKSVWDMWMLVDGMFSAWARALWDDIAVDDLIEETRVLLVQIKKLPAEARKWGAYLELKAVVENMAVVLPLVHELHSQAMRERHWKSLMAVTMTHFDKGADFCLDDLLQLGLHRFVEEVSEIVEVATKELKIEAKLKQIEKAWIPMCLEFTNYKDTDIQVIKSPEEILELLDEHEMQLQIMAGMGKFVEFFRDEVNIWQRRLNAVETTLKMWILVTRQWSSLEAIFVGSADICAQLPDDTKAFENVDQELKELNKEGIAQPVILDNCTVEGRDVQLDVMHATLEKCQKALNEYLGVKKNIFPRFYFVSNVALLDILSNGNNPPKVMPHVGDCFDALKYVLLESEEDDDKPEEPVAEGGKKVTKAPANIATTMISKDGETVPLFANFVILGAVENWLNELVKVMQDTLRQIMETALNTAANWELEKPREDWLFDYCAQIVLLASQVFFSEECEGALEELENGQEDALKSYLELCNGRLGNLILKVLGELTKQDRAKIITLITIDVHSRDLIQTLIDEKVESGGAFLWQSQLRYYWQDATRDTAIRICDFQSLYAYEYIGNCGRLVITPLTDRCYVTLTSALRLMLGGAPAGPAGTGKTETTKDLARNLGLPCYVFNCSDQMNYQTMGDIFMGLSQTGAWGCFDEFNRIAIEVLSVVATQVKLVLTAVTRFAVPANREKKYQKLPAGTPPLKVGEYEFFGDTIGLIPTTGFFITMNPGYAGRTELPENLKANFRSCAMIKPDLKPICENMLLAEGFMKARQLSIKFVTLYELCDDLLSKQAHYDWGLRAVKSVLRVAGMLKRAADPDIDESAILMRALRDFNTPKIPINDTPVFLQLVADLFPGFSLPPTIDEDLKLVCTQVCKDSGLQDDDVFIGKVVQYQELLDVRHSVMLLGCTGSGKSTIWKALADCHNHGKPKPTTVFDTVNPKSVTSDELYGYMTLAKDWKDGCLSIIMRNMCKEWAPYTAAQSQKWVVLDGDIDAVWIESMNTVMDDNKVLTLVSNERIPLTAAMRMIFEIYSLANATPATVSRAGILFLNEKDIGWRCQTDSWVARRTDESERIKLSAFFDKYIDKTIEIQRANKLVHIVPRTNAAMVSSTCNLLDGLLPPPTPESLDKLEHLFVFCVMWAFGGGLTDDKPSSRKAFSEAWRIEFPAVKFPKQGEIFDHYFDAEGSKTFAPWTGVVPEYVPMGDGDFASVMVPTADSVRLSFLSDMLVKMNNPVMFVGGAGTGKTTLARTYMKEMDPDKMLSWTINMNYYTDARSLQAQLEQPIDKRSGKTYGPPVGKRMVVMIDDLNMPFVETYGTQTPIALLRQHIDWESWFDRDDLGLKKDIKDVQYIACMNQKSGSFFINPRLQRHFTTFSCMMPGEADLRLVYGTLLDEHLGAFSNSIQKIGPSVLTALLELHRAVSENFLPSATKFHYNFNMRELGAVTQGILKSTTDNYSAPVKLMRLFMHESNRVFSDRLVNEQEVARFNDIMLDITKKRFDVDLEELHAQPLVFTSFASSAFDDEPLYLPVTSQPELKNVLQAKLDEYNEGHPIMDLVLFNQAMEHICRITRIIENPRGNAMLVGVGGSGKQSLSKLASHICGYDVFQISMTSTYGIPELKEDLKELYRKAGVKPGLPLVFMMTDAQIVDEKFLVFINDLLSSGYIPELFTGEEYDSILGALRNAAKAAGIPDARDPMMDFFISRVRANLHVILCLSPVGVKFRTRARKFPGLINCTAIDWFHPWPKEALLSVGQKFLADVDVPEDILENVAHHLAEANIAVNITSAEYLQVQGRYNYTTPKTFLELIAYYKMLLARKQQKLRDDIERLSSGVETLRSTGKDVALLQGDLAEKMIVVNEKRAGTDQILEKMGVERAGAEAQQAIADVEAEKASAAAAAAQKIEDAAQVELAVAKPALDAANEAVNCLTKGSLTELKSLSKPPAGVDKVTSAVLMMLKKEKKDFSWDNAKKMMAKIDQFKTQLETFDAGGMAPSTVSAVEGIISDPNFTAEKMKTKSAAASNLCAWVINTVIFHKIYVKVKPLMDSLEEARGTKEAAEAQLASVMAVVAEINARLGELQKVFLAATQDKAGVEAEAAECQGRLDLAERLVTGLASENERWGIEIDSMHARQVTQVGDVLLAASFVSYIGAFDASFRKHLWQDMWTADLLAREVPLTPDIDPLQVLATDADVANWMNDGLPADRVSIENGAIVTSSKRWPLLIDPQLQGIKWLRRREERLAREGEGAPPAKPDAEVEEGDAEGAAAGEEGEEGEEGAPKASGGGGGGGGGLVILQMTQRGWLRKVMVAITEGCAVIIENVGEDIDAVLDPVLSRSVYHKGRQLFLNLGGEEVEYDPNFRLFLQTKLSNPHYKPELAAQCTLVNFIVTERGLEEQLLAHVVKLEQPELESQKQELQQAFNQYQIQLLQLEDNLLEALANAPADILSDVPLIEGLEATKVCIAACCRCAVVVAATAAATAAAAAAAAAAARLVD